MAQENAQEAGSGWPGPVADHAFHGLAGRIVRAVSPLTEADPLAILGHLLVAIGAAAGPAVHAIAGGDEHPARLFAAFVGETAKARKGTAAAIVRRIVGLADPVFASTRVVEGLSTGEGLISAVRDPNPPDPGISDKRLLVGESEFARTLRVAGREGNTLTATLRQAWDSGQMGVLTRSSPLRSTGAHIALYCHITKEELVRYLTRTEMASGFGNRFLWLAVRRARLLPHGDAVSDDLLNPFAREIRDVLSWARDRRIVRWSVTADREWAAVYPSLSRGRPGLAGYMLARAEAQTLRLAVAYALIDMSDELRPEHLHAALALMLHVEASVRWIFGNASGNPIADTILAALVDRSLDRTEIYDLFSRHLSKAEIEAALASLERSGLAAQTTISTDGRPREVWSAVKK